MIDPHKPLRIVVRDGGRFNVVFPDHIVRMRFLAFACCDDGVRMIAFPHDKEWPRYCPFCGAPTDALAPQIGRAGGQV
jgi:hypothetical protein